jgi:hypothetical protein
MAASEVITHERPRSRILDDRVTDIGRRPQETISARGRFEDVHRGGYDPEQHLEDMALDGVGGEVLYPSQGLFYFKVADPPLMSAIFRVYNDWLADARRAAVRGLPHGSRPPQGDRDDQPG